MRIENHHRRFVPIDAARAGELLASLASEDDQLWPKESWPPMRLDKGLAVGSAGGHAHIRYRVVDYQPGERVEFAFDPAIGIDGRHGFVIEPVDGGVLLSHHISGAASGAMLLAWPLAVRWLHDALVEDAFDGVARQVGAPAEASWSPWVRFLRRLYGA